MKIRFLSLVLISGLAATPTLAQDFQENGSTSRGRTPDGSTKLAAQDLVRRVGVGCQVSAALALGSDVNGTPRYEVSCEGGPGYVLIGSPVNEAINCLSLARPTDSRARRGARSRTCRLPGNRNTVAAFAQLARRAGMACRVDEGAMVGLSSDRVPIYEIGCAGSAGGWIEHTTRGWRLKDCLTVEAQGSSCRFTSPREQLVVFRDRLPAHVLSVCNPVRARFMGQGNSGSFYEADCAGNTSVVLVFGTAGEFTEIIPCTEARLIGGGCRLRAIIPNRAMP